MKKTQSLKKTQMTFRFEGVRLMKSEGGFGAFILGCEIAFLVFVGYFTIHEIKMMFKLKKNYWKNYWSYCELSIIIASYLLIAFYFLRYSEPTEGINIFITMKLAINFIKVYI